MLLRLIVACAAGLIGYTYVGYPLVLYVLGWLRRARRPAAAVVDWPMVTVCVPAYNEARAIGRTIEALLELDYPRDRLQLLVISDASTDGTDDLVRGFRDRGVELLSLPVRAGKTAAENAAWAHLRGEIVVNTDASIRLARSAVRHLVAAFGDPTVGVASGRDVSVSGRGPWTNAGEARYVGYEMAIRELETRVAGIVGASGCLYAIRKRLQAERVPAALSRDFAAALLARERGYRAVSVRAAVCFVPRALSLRQEYRRKVRTITRGLETLWFKRGLLNPLRHGVFAWMLFSHKVCRWLVPWAVAAAVIALAALALAEPWARWVLAPVGCGGVLAVLGWAWPEGRAVPPLLAIPAYSVAAHIACLRAWWHAWRGELSPLWEPTRRDVTAPVAAAPAER